ncbi:MAG: maleylacetoacetate isomerase [Gammaproteobacteria bacterium]|jgi:maleylacetoacetate isomerase
MILYSNAFNSAGERVRIALALKNIPYDYVSIQDLGWAEYEKVNPQALLPTLKVEDDLLVQSTAILEYLEESFPAPQLLPEDQILRAQARGFAQAIASEMHAIDTLRVRLFLGHELKVDPQGIEHWTDHWLAKGLTALEAFLCARTHDWPYCFGSEPGWADLFLVPALRKAVNRYNLDTTPYPLLAKVYAQCLTHHAVIAAAPEQQSDYARAYDKIWVRCRDGSGPIATKSQVI